MRVTETTNLRTNPTTDRLSISSPYQIYHFTIFAPHGTGSPKINPPSNMREAVWLYHFYHFAPLPVSPVYYSSILAPLCASHLTITTRFAALTALTIYHFHFTPNTGFTVAPRPLPAYSFTICRAFFITFTTLPESNRWPLIDDLAGGRIDRRVGRYPMGRFLGVLYPWVDSSNNSVDGALIRPAAHWAILRLVR